MKHFNLIHFYPEDCMKSPLLALFISLIIPSLSPAQDNSLDRDEVSVIKKKLVTVQKAMGGDPEGYSKESEDFSLPTDFTPAEKGKFWPITSSISLRYGDKASKDSEAGVKKSAADFQAKYAAAVASGDGEAMAKAVQDMQKTSQDASAAAMNPKKKEQLTIYVQFNTSPNAGIDPDAVLFEKSGVIALKSKQADSEKGQVVVYIDPVALKETKKLSKVDLKTPADGVSKKNGVFNITIQIDGNVTDAEAWASITSLSDFIFWFACSRVSVRAIFASGY